MFNFNRAAGIASLSIPAGTVGGEQFPDLYAVIRLDKAGRDFFVTGIVVDGSGTSLVSLTQADDTRILRRDCLDDQYRPARWAIAEDGYWFDGHATLEVASRALLASLITRARLRIVSARLGTEVTQPEVGDLYDA